MLISALWWLFFNLASLAFLAFYSMIEMACVSFNKVRLHYYVFKGNTRAKWLHYLLDHPFRLFGTTLIGVNVAMVIGSECAREFHSAIGLNPDLAPLSQVAIVIIFGELAPMFAARNYAENVAMLGAPLLFASAKILTPCIWVIGWITKGVNFLINGQRSTTDYFLSQEELQKILEEKSEPFATGDVEAFNLLTRNIFQLRHKSAKDVMTPLEETTKLPSNATIAQMKNIVKQQRSDFVVIYQSAYTDIVGIAFPRDLLRASDNKRVRTFSKPPWFVTENTQLTEILHQFRRNKQRVAIILDKNGKANGLITLDDLLEKIFGEKESKSIKEKSLLFIERTFAGDMLVREFNNQFNVILDKNEDITLSQLMHKFLGHKPEENTSIYIEPFELIAKEATLLEVKSVTVKTRAK